MSLDSRYMIASDLQSLFRDKDSGLPLRNGVVYFWADEARTVPKNVFQLSGSPPNYSYTNLGAVINLTAIGTMSDNNGDDIILYYFPYDANGNVQLYYVQVFSEGGILHGAEQWTREAWPNFTSATTGSEDFVNYVPNGQFLIHNNIPANPANNIVFGQITQPITTLSQGGWTFERPNGSTATDIVTFVPFGSAVTNPSANPKFGLRVNTQMPNAGDTFKDARLKFPDVNKFASDTQKYTFALSGISNTANNQTVQLILIKNFGSGGSATTETTLATFTITPSYTISQVSFAFGTNLSATIGVNNDDYLQLAIRYPVGSVSDITITDVILAPDAFTVNAFPATPNNEFNFRAIAGWMPTPDYNSQDLYLPLILTPSGITFDHGTIGNIVKEITTTNYTNSINTLTNLLLMDGSQYKTSDFSPLGIPYSRLQKYLFNIGLGAPICGTGKNYLTAIFLQQTPGLPNELRISTNSAGLVTNSTDGAAPTGFTFNTIHKGFDSGGSTGYVCKSYLISTTDFYIQNLEAGVVPDPTAGNCGFGVSAYQVGSTVLPEIAAFSAIAATTLSSKYFTFSTYSGGQQPFYCWFKVDGVGTDPAPGGTGIEVDLTSADTAENVASKVQEALNGWQLTTILISAGNIIPASSYFNISTLSKNYYVWYMVDGVGTDPKISDKIGIEVQILSTDTSAQVASKTQIAINMQYYATPDWRGYFIRGLDLSAGNDPDVATRWSMVPGIINSAPATFQLSQNIQHYHLAISATTISGQVNGAFVDKTPAGNSDVTTGTTFGVSTLSASTSTTIEDMGGQQSNPINAVAVLAIRY